MLGLGTRVIAECAEACAGVAGDEGVSKRAASRPNPPATITMNTIKAVRFTAPPASAFC